MTYKDTEGVRTATIRSVQYLGRIEPLTTETRPIAVFYLTYRFGAGQGCDIASKLFLPVGEAPDTGWPVSIWSHGFGDPASDFRRWPFVGDKWRQTRGELPGRWARYGIATLTPWLPGAGPSEPLATYSPLSLERNFRAIADGFRALRELDAVFSDCRRLLDWLGSDLRLDHSRQVLRTDCVSTPLLVYFANRWDTLPACDGLKALVADDFQPSIAYNLLYLAPVIRSLPGRSAAAIYAIWGRIIWSLAFEQRWSLTRFFSEQAVCLLAQLVGTPIGASPLMVASRLVPPTESKLASVILAAVARDLGREPTGEDIRDWIFSQKMITLMSTRTLEQIVTNSTYRRYFAPSDPFFSETIEPFCPGLPLLIVARTGQGAIQETGMPSFDERFQNMTMPKIDTLRSWGWDVRLCHGRDQGTSFSEGPAQHWSLNELSKLLC